MDDILLALTAEIVSAHVTNNAVASAELPTLIASVHRALAGAALPETPSMPALEPAVAINRSIKPDYIVCLEDGAKLKMLTRYLKSRFGLTPQAYREKWGLPKDYPMVAPNYRERRREIAKQIGLGGRKR